MYPEVKALKVSYISLQKSSESPQLDVFRADDCFQLLSLTGRNRNRRIFSCLKPILAELRKLLLQTHMHQWYGREQNRPFFPGGVNGGGEECQHLCWGYFLFYSCFLRDASERCGESAGTGLRSRPLYLMSVHVGRKGSYQTRHSS